MSAIDTTKRFDDFIARHDYPLHGSGFTGQLCHMGHALMGNRTGLVVAVEVTGATGMAEREAAKRMVDRRSSSPARPLAPTKATTCPRWLKRCARRGSRRRWHRTLIDGRSTRHTGYRTSLKIRKRIEEVFGSAKTIGGLRNQAARCEEGDGTAGIHHRR